MKKNSPKKDPPKAAPRSKQRNSPPVQEVPDTATAPQSSHPQPQPLPRGQTKEKAAPPEHSAPSTTKNIGSVSDKPQSPKAAPRRSGQAPNVRTGSPPQLAVYSPEPPTQNAAQETTAAEPIRTSRLALKHNQVFPATSPQGRLRISRKLFFSSDQNLTQEPGGFMIPQPGALLASDENLVASGSPADENGPEVGSKKKEEDHGSGATKDPRKSVSASSTKRRPLEVESVATLRRSPGRTQVPPHVVEEKRPFRTGIFRLKVKPVDSAVEGEKVLRQKPAVVNLAPVSPKSKTPVSPKPKSLEPVSPNPKSEAPTSKPIGKRWPWSKMSSKKPTKKTPSPEVKLTGKKWEKIRRVLSYKELPKSDYLVGEDEEEAEMLPIVPPPPPVVQPQPPSPKQPKKKMPPLPPPTLKSPDNPDNAVPSKRQNSPPVTNTARPKSPAKAKTSENAPKVIPRSSNSESAPKLTQKMKEKLAEKVEAQRREHREQHLKHLHAKYTWRRFYTLTKAEIKRMKEEEEAEQKRIEEAKKKRKSDKQKKLKKSWFVKLIEYFDEDEGEDFSEDSLDEEEQILQRTSFQQLKLGERRAEIRGVNQGHVAIDMPVPSKDKEHRRGSEVIRKQQVAAATRRVRNGGSLGMAIPESTHPLNMDNIQKTSSYDDFTKAVRTSLPSAYAVPHDDAAMRLFDKLVPLLKGNQLHEDRILAAEDALDEFRVAKLHLGQNQADGEADALSGIRFLPGNLEERRGVMTKLEDSRANEGCRKRAKYFFKDVWMTITVRFGEIFKLTEIWHEPLHQIEMNFGVSASTYFRWLRSVLLLNYLYCLFSLGFIVIPEVITGDTFHNITTHDLFLAESYRSSSKFFYGMYKYTPVDRSKAAIENTALRFLIVLILITLLDSIFIGLKVRTYYMRMTAKISDVDKAGDINFFSLFLSAWDYNLTSETAVKVQRRTIARDFNRMMDRYEEQLKRRGSHPDEDPTAEKSEDGGHYWAANAKHWVINFIMLGVAAAFGYGVHYLLSHRSYREDNETLEHTQTTIEISSSVLISLVLNIFSPLCSWVTSFETFKTTKEKIFVTVFRLGSFYMSILSVLYSFWISSSLRIPKWKYPPDYCWEEDTGTEIYRLIVFEGITNAASTILRYILFPVIKAKWMKRKFEKSVFDVEYFTLNLIFVHTLSGVGTFFFPLLPVVVIGRLVITFYWKKFVLHHFCAYPRYQVHPSEIFAPYVVAFFCSYLCVVISNSWLLSEEHPSASCGPFAGYSNRTYSYVFQDVVTSNFGKFARYWVSPWFLYCAIVILCAVVYTFHAWSAAYFDTMNLLHDLLRLERVDREFLLKAMYNIPGVERQKRESQDSASSIQQREREHERKTTDLASFLQQQEALAKLFQEHHGIAEDSTSVRSNGSDDSISLQTLEEPASAEATEGLTEKEKRHAATRRYKHLMLSSKAVQLLRRNPRRLSKAGAIYSNLVEKVIDLEHENKTDEHTSSKY